MTDHTTPHGTRIFLRTYFFSFSFSSFAFPFFYFLLFFFDCFLLFLIFHIFLFFLFSRFKSFESEKATWIFGQQKSREKCRICEEQSTYKKNYWRYKSIFLSFVTVDFIFYFHFYFSLLFFHFSFLKYYVSYLFDFSIFLTIIIESYIIRYNYK